MKVDFSQLIVAILVIISLVYAILMPRFDTPQECWQTRDPQLCKVIIENGGTLR